MKINLIYPDYVRMHYYWHRHHERYALFVENMARKLTCQNCGGVGYFHIPILDFGEGPDEDCGWCEGTGLLTPHRRGQFLNMKRQEKNRHGVNKGSGSSVGLTQTDGGNTL